LGLDVGTVTGKVQFDLATAALTEAVSKLADVAAALTKVGEKSKQTGPSVESDISKINEAYRRLAASLDPVVAGQKRYQDAHITLDAALKRGLISHAQYEQALERAKEKFLSAGGGLTQFQTLLGKLTELTGTAGPAAAEAAEKLGLLGEKAVKISELVEVLGPLAPALIGIAAAVAAIGLAWKATEFGFEFLKESVIEGEKYRQTLVQLEASLRSNGSASGLSARNMQALAESYVTLAGRDDDVILGAELILSRFEKIGREAFPAATRAALDLSSATGKDLRSSSELIGKILEGNTRSLRSFADVGIVLTKGQRDMLTEMVESGRIAEYQQHVFAILTEKIGGAAEAYAHTLSGAITIAKTVMGEFRKGIASEVIPALEDLVNDLTGSVGGWDSIRAASAELGHDIGEMIREVIYKIRLWYHEWEQLTWEVSAKVQNAIGTLIGGTIDGLSKLFEFLAKIPGPTSGALLVVAQTAKSVADDVSLHFAKGAGDAMRHVGEEVLAIATLTAQYKIHRQALEGSDEVYKKHGSAIDDVGKKEKALQSIYEDIAKVLQAYDDKLDDQTRKLLLSRDAKESLLAAAQAGLYEYAVEVDAQARLAAVTAQTIALDKEHRTEIEALTAVEQKLRDLRKTGEAAKVAVEIEAINKKYVEQRAEVASLANANYTLESSIKHTIAAMSEERSLSAQLATLDAQLADVRNRNTEATRALSLAQADERDELALLSPLYRAILDLERQQIDTKKEQLNIDRLIRASAGSVGDVKAVVDDWEEQRAAALAYGASVASVLQQFGLLSSATQKRKIEERLLAEQERGANAEQLALLRARLEGDQAQINSLHAVQAAVVISEQRYKEFADSLSQEFSSLIGNFLNGADVKLADFANASRDTFVNVLQHTIQDWLTQWFEAMAQWLLRWIATQAAAKAAQAGLGSGGGYSVSSAGNFGGGFTSLGSGGGGYAGLVGSAGTAGVAGSGSGAAGLFSGTGSAGALGAVGAWAAVLVVFGLLVNSLNDHLQKTKESIIQFDESLNVATSTGDNKTIGLITAGQALAKQVKSFFDAFGGIFQGLDASIGIKHRGQGSNSEWKVYVDGLMTNFGRDMEAALNYALIESIRHTSSIGLDPLVVAAIHDYTGKSLDEFKAQVEFAQRLATQNLPGVSGQVASAASQYFADLHQAQTTFKDDATALDTAIASITRKFSDTVQALKNSALGIDTSTADFLASLAAFDDQMKKGAAAQRKDIEDRIAATEQEIKALGNGPRLSKGSDADERSAAKTKWDETIATLRHQIDVYTAELAKIPTQLSDSEISMAIFDSLYKYLDGSAKYAEQAHKYAVLKVELEFAAIQAQLVALGRWEEFAGMFADAHDAAINIAANPTANVPTRGTGAGGNTRAQDAQTLADFFAQFARTQLPALSAAIYDINKRYDDAIKLAHGNAEALAKLNEQRAIEIRQAKEQARASAVSPAQAFIDSTLPSLVTQINAVHTGAQGLIDGLRAVAAQGGLSTAELHKLVAALRAAEAAQVAAIKSGILDSINQFAATLSNQGLTGQLANIATQALKLRESLNALAQAGTLTADEFFAAAGKLADAAKAQQQAAFDTSATSLLSQLYGYLHEDTKAAKLKFDLTLASLQIQEAQLEQAVALYGLVGDYIPEIKDLIERFRKAGPGILASGSSGTNFTDPATVLALAAQNQANAATTLSNAAQAFAASTDKLIAYQQSLLTNPSLSPLTPDQQRAEALRQLQANYASGLGGNIDARNAFSGLADTFLRISKGVNPSTLGYGVDFQRVQDMLTRLIGQTSYQIPGTSNVYSGPFGSGGNGGLGTGSGAGGAGGLGGLGVNPTSVIDLSPVVLSVQSSSNRNHEDLGMLNVQLTRLTSAVQEQQGKLSRIANYLERAA